jgi:pimeloyl-ACP methyl ester carboxylesterase
MGSLIEDISKVSSETVYGDLLSCDRFDITGEIGTIATPTLIMCGNDDKMTPPDYSKELTEKITGAKLALIKNSGHFVMMENAEDFNSALKDFINSL